MVGYWTADAFSSLLDILLMSNYTPYSNVGAAMVLRRRMCSAATPARRSSNSTSSKIKLVRLPRYIKNVLGIVQVFSFAWESTGAIWYLSHGVADLWHIGTDPDPRIRTSDKRIRIQSGTVSGSCYFRQWPSRWQDFLLIAFWSYILHHFPKIKSHKEVTKQ
jgi:hypothetical protein